MFNESPIKYHGSEVKLMTKLDGYKLAFSALHNVKINNGSTYKLSLIVKKPDIGEGFGLRIQGVYSQRVDAIFDLNLGKVIGAEIHELELAENNRATIESLGDGCSNVPCTKTFMQTM